MKPNIAIELIDCLPDIEKSIEVLRVIEHACIKKRNEIRSHLREREQATAEQRRRTSRKRRFAPNPNVVAKAGGTFTDR